MRDSLVPVLTVVCPAQMAARGASDMISEEREQRCRRDRPASLQG